MSIIALESVAIEAAVDTVKPALVPAAVFVFVEAILVAETVVGILLNEVNPADPGATVITLLLGLALLGNFFCGVVAARAAGFAGQFENAKHEGPAALTDWSDLVEAIGVSPGPDIAGVDIGAAENEPRMLVGKSYENFSGPCHFCEFVGGAPLFELDSAANFTGLIGGKVVHA